MQLVCNGARMSLARGVTCVCIIDVPISLPCSTRLFGRNMKLPLALLLPIVAVLFFALSVALSPFFALVFVLVYPGFVTVEVKLQTAWRNAYFWAGWKDTIIATGQNLQQYWYACTLGVREVLRTVRRKAWAYQYEVHPLDILLAFLMVPIGGALASLVLLVMLVVKLPFMVLRAYANHFASARDWFRGPVMGIAWVAALPAIPLAAALLVPATPIFAFYQAVEAAGILLAKNGDLLPPLVHLAAVAAKINRDTTRYILRMDVPFILPSRNPLSPLWLLAGLGPTILALINVPIVMLAVVFMSFVPVLFACWAKILHKMKTSAAGSKPYVAPLLVFGLILAVPGAPSE